MSDLDLTLTLCCTLHLFLFIMFQEMTELNRKNIRVHYQTSFHISLRADAAAPQVGITISDYDRQVGHKAKFLQPSYWR